MLYENALYPYVERALKVNTTQRIDFKGKLTQCTITKSETKGDTRVLEVEVRCYQSHLANKQKKATHNRSLFFGSSEPVETNPMSTERYRLEFDAASRD